MITPQLSWDGDRPAWSDLFPAASPPEAPEEDEGPTREEVLAERSAQFFRGLAKHSKAK